MYRLNLPSFEIKIGGTKQHPTIWDILRNKYVALTPEEWVRQHFIHFLINEKGFPKALLANEVVLNVGDKTLRADSVLYNRELRACMIVEYKAPTVPINQKVFDQVLAYNSQLQVDYLIVSNGLKHYCCQIDYEKKTYNFLPDIPMYPDLVSF